MKYFRYANYGMAAYFWQRLHFLLEIDSQKLDNVRVAYLTEQTTFFLKSTNSVVGDSPP